MGEGLTPFEVEATGRLGQAAMTLIKAVVPRDETFILSQFYGSPPSAAKRGLCVSKVGIFKSLGT
jgi:hypothetical protein